MAVSSLVSTPTVPSETFTVEDFIACRSADNMTYYNLSILARSVTDDGIIYSKNFLTCQAKILNQILF